MTMPRPPKKKFPVQTNPPGRFPSELPPTEDIPPELQALLGQVSQTGYGGQYSLLTFLNYWNEVKPFELYKVRLTDFLGRLYFEKMQQLEDEYRNELANPGKYDSPESSKAKFNEAVANLTKDVKDAETTADWYQSQHWPLEKMPYYKEIEAQSQGVRDFSPLIQQNYKDFVKQRQLEEMQTQADQAELAQQQQDYVTKVGQQAVIPQQKERLSQYQQGREAAQYPMSTEARIALMEAVQRGEISNEEAYGPGSAWEKWQQSQSQSSATPLQFQEQGNILSQTVSGTTPEQRQTVATARIATEQERIQQNAQNLTRQNQMLAAQYPDVYKQFLAGQGGVQSNDPYGFYNWANAPEQTAFQQKVKADELNNWRTYGDIYGAYQDYLNQDNPEMLPIQKWIEKDPQIKLAWERRDASRRIPKSPAGVWR